MPTLREPRLASRKSIASDPRLYERQSDGSDTESPFAPPQSYSRQSRPVAAEKAAEGPKMKRARLSTKETPPTPGSSSVRLAPISVAETPVQIKNILFRNGEATPGRSIRRASGGKSAKRGSGIGTGFEAAPHPGVPDDKLYRSTDIEAPLAIRLRSLASWTAQRSRDEIFSIRSEAEDSKQLSYEIIEDFIGGICNKSVDVSAQQNLEIAKSQQNKLPPHPQNALNFAKMTELTGNHAAISQEEDDRRTILVKYDSLGAERRKSYLPALGPIAVHLNKLLVVNTADMDTAAQFGETVLQNSGVALKPVKSSNRKDKNYLPNLTNEAADDAALQLRLQSLSFRHANHRLSQFARTASLYTDIRLDQAHRALAAEGHRGLDDYQPSPLMDAGGLSQGDIARVISGSEGAVRSVATSSNSVPEARDLLRAIADTDMLR